MDRQNFADAERDAEDIDEAMDLNLSFAVPLSLPTTRAVSRTCHPSRSTRSFSIILVIAVLVIDRTQHSVAFSSEGRMSDAGFRLGYVTDVEGHLDYFEQFVAHSNVLDKVEESSTKDRLDLRLRDGCYFVYGGDAVDKGPGDIRLCRALVSLKKRYPDRVFLLVGNRDLNKLRFSAELSEQDMNRSIDDIPPPHWDPGAPTLRSYLERVAKCRGLQSVEDVNTRVDRLQYMLKHTLGCPDTFEFRRQELAVLANDNNCDVNAISDERVLESFVNEVEHPEGSLRQYLENANVAAVVGNTLFVHGAVDANTMKYIPRRDTRFERPLSRPPPGKMCDDLNEWVDALNDFLEAGLLDYRSRPFWDEDRTSRGGGALLALQNRAAVWGRSIISNCYGDGGCITTNHALLYLDDPNRSELEERDPLVFENVSSNPRDPKVAAWLKDNHIRRVIVGHKPTGDCPAVLSAIYTGVEIVSGDTSYSDVTADDNRGMALPNIEIVGKSAIDNQLEISGRLSDGRVYHSVFNRLHGDEIDETVGDSNLGIETKDGFWIKAHTSEHYRLCRGKGREVEHNDVPKVTIADMRSL